MANENTQQKAEDDLIARALEDQTQDSTGENTGNGDDDD